MPAFAGLPHFNLHFIGKGLCLPLSVLSLLGKALPDNNVTIGDLRTRVAEFVSAREWEQFHDPKNLSMALSVEAAELMEHFLWMSPDGSRKEAEIEEKQKEIGEEIADITCLIFALCNSIGIDLSETFLKKMARNEMKYPAGDCKGNYHPPGGKNK